MPLQPIPAVRSHPRAASRVGRPQTWARRAGEPWAPPSGDESPAGVACGRLWHRHGFAHVHTHAGLLRHSDTQTLTPTLTPAPSHAPLTGRSRIGCTRGFRRRPEGGWNDGILTEPMWLGQVVSLESCAQCRPTEGNSPQNAPGASLLRGPGARVEPWRAQTVCRLRVFHWLPALWLCPQVERIHPKSIQNAQIIPGFHFPKILMLYFILILFFFFGAKLAQGREGR